MLDMETNPTLQGAKYTSTVSAQQFEEKEKEIDADSNFKDKNRE